MKVPFFIISFILSLSFSVRGQDLQLSQYYAAPMYLNPAFTGATENTRFGLNYRHQWTGAGGAATGMLATGEHYFEDFKSAVGIMANKTSEGVGSITQASYSLLYSYEIQWNKHHVLHAGLQASTNTLSINGGDLDFGDEFDQNGLTGNGTSERFTTQSRGFKDFGFGLLTFGHNAFYGISLHHLNQPDISFLGSNESLPMKFSAHGGYKWHFDHQEEGLYDKPEHSLIFTGNYKIQGRFDQLDAGVYLINEPLLIGLWYRGIPVKGDQFAESIVFIGGMHLHKLHIGYSYDLVLNGLLLRGGAVHEISLSYEFNWDLKRKPKESLPTQRRNTNIVKRLPCPKF